MKLLLSKPLVEELSLTLKTGAAQLIDDGIEPHLAVVLVGAHPDSLRYISIKTQVAKEVGVIVSLYHLEETASYEEIEQTISYLNEDAEVHGIILQLPLPEQFTLEQTDKLLCSIVPEKDVDGLGGYWQKEQWNALTTKQLLQPQPKLLPPMVGAVVSLLDHYGLSASGKKIVLVGKGRLVGGPLLSYFESCGLDVTAVDEETENILDITSQADLLISGTGEPNLITYQWVNPGSIVIDCAEDVHEDSVGQVAEALAPARGGVGPLTVIWLLHNTIQAALNASRRNHG